MDLNPTEGHRTELPQRLRPGLGWRQYTHSSVVFLVVDEREESQHWHLSETMPDYVRHEATTLELCDDCKQAQPPVAQPPQYLYPFPPHQDLGYREVQRKVEFSRRLLYAMEDARRQCCGYRTYRGDRKVRVRRVGHAYN